MPSGQINIGKRLQDYHGNINIHIGWQILFRNIYQQRPAHQNWNMQAIDNKLGGSFFRRRKWVGYLQRPNKTQ